MLLFKCIVLLVFVSDVLLFVVYVLDEIFLIFLVVGVMVYVFSWKIGLIVVFVMFVVVASYW